MYASALLRRPSRARALLALRKLPIVEPRMSAQELDRWRAARWPEGGEPLFGGHWAQAVIGTSPKEREYLNGRHRQAVRTNIRRAQEQGIVAMRLDEYWEFAAAAASVYEGRDGGEAVLAHMHSPMPPERFTWYCASVARGKPVVIAAVALFGDAGVLAVMVGDLRNSRAGHARYLLHNFIRSDLAAQGIRHLIVGSVLREPSGNLYFQRLLGYRICNIRPKLITPSGEARRDARPRFRRLLMTGAASERASEPVRTRSLRSRPRRSEPIAESPPVEPTVSLLVSERADG